MNKVKWVKSIKRALPVFVVLVLLFAITIPAMAVTINYNPPDWDKSSLKFTGQGQTTTGTGTVTFTKEIYGTAPAEVSGEYEIVINGTQEQIFTLTDGDSETIKLPAGSYTVTESDSYGATVSYSPSSSFTVSGNTTQIYAIVKNNGSAMSGTSEWELYYAASGNPKGGTRVASGEIPALAKDTNHTITYNPTVKGNYMFKAYQRPGHPGTGVLWSKAIAVKNVGSDTQQIKIKNTYIPIPNPDIAITKEGPDFASPGDNIVYSFTVTNTGNVTLTDVTVTDQFFGSDWNRNIGTLAVSDSVTFTESYIIPADANESLINTAEVTGYYNDDPINDEDSFNVPIITLEEENNPTITIDKTGPESASPGDEITYEFTVTNTGNVDLTDIVVTDPLFGTEWSHSIETLAAGDSDNFLQNYLIPANATGTIKNTVTATVYYNNEAYSDSDSHEVTITSSTSGGGGGTTPTGGGGGGGSSGGGTVVVPPEEPAAPPEPPKKPGEVIVPPEEPTTEPEVIIPPEEPKAQPEKEKLPYTGTSTTELLGLLIGVVLAGSGLFFLRRSRVK